MNPPTKTIKREQFRQAKQVHGGLWKFLIAVLGVLKSANVSKRGSN